MGRNTLLDYELAEAMYALNRAITQVELSNRPLKERIDLNDLLVKQRDEIVHLRMGLDPTLKL